MKVNDWLLLVVGALLAIFLATVLFVAEARSGQPEIYVEIVVKACPADPNDVERCEPAATGSQGLPNGMCPKAVAQGEGEEARQHSKSKAERNGYWAKLGCIDVPIPPEVVTQDMTMGKCKSKGGYLASMQYLEQTWTIEQKAVGGWVCVPHAYPVSGVAGM